jgi:hypothetical protein
MGRKIRMEKFGNGVGGYSHCYGGYHDHVILVSYCSGGGHGDNVHGKQTLWTKTTPEKGFAFH